jgi:hypothetical protein
VNLTSTLCAEGMLVSENAIVKAQEKLNEILRPIQENQARVKFLRAEIHRLEVLARKIEYESTNLLEKYLTLLNSGTSSCYVLIYSMVCCTTQLIDNTFIS